MKKNKFKKLLKKLKKFRLYKGYSPIAVVVLSNAEELNTLADSSNDSRYLLVPQYHHLEFDILPYERMSDRLTRKRRSIKKKIGKTRFKILLGYWSLGVEFFETEEYQALSLKKKKRCKTKR